MKIFITGGSGMLGKVLVKHFDDVVAPSQEEFDLLKPIFTFPKCEVIIHCAAMTVVDECEKNQALCKRVNVDGTATMVELARLWNAKIFFISTPMVFSGKKGNYRETDRTSPANFYGWTKREGEKLVLRYSRGTVIRANPIGVRPQGSFPSFIQWFVDAARANRSFELFNDVTINPVSTKTFAKVLEVIAKGDFDVGILHLGSRDVANKAEIWKRIVGYFPEFSAIVRSVTVDATVAGKTASRPKKMWLNVERIKKEYGVPMPAWCDEVDAVLNELRVI